ncbi:hypothetical protein GCM10027037_22000 [Mucilaginibacter koreensis]
MYALVFSNGAYPYLYPLIMLITMGLHAFTPWVGAHLLHLPEAITIFTNGSGDTTYDYVNLLIVLIISLIGCAVWSLVDRKTIGYPKMYYWLTVAVRYYIAFTMVTYGLVKVFQLQFPPTAYSRMLQTFGDFSPMGLAWTFYGFSHGYNILIGIAELSAITLLFRRTVTFGAIIALFTSLNIMAVNYFFDVPVKIVSTGLVVMSLFLLSPNIVNLCRFFFKDEQVKLWVIRMAPFRKKWMCITRLVLKALLVLYVVAGFVGTGMRYAEMTKITNTLHGAYKIDSYTVNGQQLPPNSPNLQNQWKSIAFEKNGFGSIQHPGSKTEYFSVTQNSAKKMLLLKRQSSQQTDTLNYKQLSPTQLQLFGKFEGQRIDVALSRIKFELNDRGFHWVSEQPYNR